MVEIRDIAGPLARRIASLLQAQVSVQDDCGKVIGCSPSKVRAASEVDQIRVPIRWRGRSGEVVLCMMGETASPQVLRAVVEMTLSEVLTTTELQNHHTLSATFIHDLLLGHLQDEADILRQGQILGMDLSRPRAVILIEAGDHILPATSHGRTQGRERSIRRRAQEIIDAVVSFFELPSDAICAHIGQGEVAVLKASSTRDLAAWAGPDEQARPAASWADLDALKRAASALLAHLHATTGKTLSVGIGRYHPGVLRLARSYEDARAALALGCRFQGRNRVHCLDGLGIAAFVGVSHEMTRLSLANHLLSPLDEEPELIETMVTFFDLDCSASRVAQALSIHRNTLTYRLDKIASLTGLDPRRFDHAVQIRLALLLQALHDVRPASTAARPVGECQPGSLEHPPLLLEEDSAPAPVSIQDLGRSAARTAYVARGTRARSATG